MKRNFVKEFLQLYEDAFSAGPAVVSNNFSNFVPEHIIRLDCSDSEDKEKENNGFN